MQLLRSLLSAARAALGLVSPLGWTVAALGMAAWVAGVWWGWDELLVIAAACLVLIVMAIGFTIGRLDLSARIGVQPARVVVGDPATGELEILNQRHRAVRGLRIELPVGQTIAVFSEPVLKGGESTDELFRVKTDRRAVIPVGPLTTVQGDPLGLLRRTRQWTGVEEIYVHPRTEPLSTIAAGQIRDLEGQTTSALSPSDVAFHTLRSYVRGDDMRHVHWKSSAKIGELMIRQYNDTRRSHVAVLLSIDPDEYADDDEFELGISCAASVAVQALRDDQTLTVIAGGVQLPAVNPTRLLDRFSAIESVAGQGGIESTARAARRLARDASVGVMCVGSTLGVADVRRISARAGLDVNTVVLRADHAAAPSYQAVGTSRFLNVPRLETLRRGVEAVTA